jgi:hypothetical protein
MRPVFSEEKSHEGEKTGSFVVGCDAVHALLMGAPVRKQP